MNILHEFFNHASDACPLGASGQEKMELSFQKWYDEEFHPVGLHKKYFDWPYGYANIHRVCKSIYVVYAFKEGDEEGKGKETYIGLCYSLKQCEELYYNNI